MKVEFWPPAIRESGDNPLAVLNEYARMGYEVRVLGADEGPGPPPAEVVELAPATHG